MCMSVYVSVCISYVYVYPHAIYILFGYKGKNKIVKTRQTNKKDLRPMFFLQELTFRISI